jgi:hypothetical protein
LRFCPECIKPLISWASVDFAVRGGFSSNTHLNSLKKIYILDGHTCSIQQRSQLGWRPPQRVPIEFRMYCMGSVEEDKEQQEELQSWHNNNPNFDRNLSHWHPTDRGNQ